MPDVTAVREAGRLVRLPGTDWEVWGDAVLRSAGFPAAGLDRLAAPACAEAADGLLDGRLGADAFPVAFEAAAAAVSRELFAIAGDPLFREAVTWQNPEALRALDGLVRSGPAPRQGDPKRARYRRRHREELVARYWQRYCAKNETTGFFGPVCWVRLDPEAAAVVARPGPGLVRRRRLFLEHWAVAALADRLAEEPVLRRWLPPALQPHLALDGRRVLHPSRPPLELAPVEVAVLARIDGRRPAVDVARAVVADETVAVFGEADVLALVGRLAERGLLTWGVDVPLGPAAEDVLRERLAAIPEPAARAHALGALERLSSARGAVAAAAGDPAALAAALAELDAEFTALTGRDPRRRPGGAYAGRTLCHEETVRDLDLVVGGPVLESLARPLAVLLQAARWLSAAIAGAYRAALADLYDDLTAGLGSSEVPLGRLWFLAQGPLFGGGERPADRVSAEFARRWADLFGLDRVAPGTRRLALAAEDLAGRVVSTFPADRPGWAGARLHSPDLHVCAASADALRRGDFTLVLGEMHAAWATLDSAVFVHAHPAPEELRRAMTRDLGPGRVLLRYPADWPRYTGRVARCLDADGDWALAFTPAPGALRGRPLSIAELTVARSGAELVARTADGRTWPLIEVFGELVATHTADAFKLVAAGAHTPRITIDRLVVARETWRTTVAATGLAARDTYDGQYLAGRRWRRRLDLPERVFVRIATETKPVYVDLTGPRYVSSLCSMLRSAGGEVPVVVSEMLPGPDQAWVPDAAGRRYLSELRLQVRDPESAR
jgi:hypothetical protein